MRYFYLQLKRNLKILPIVVIISALLFVSMAAIMQGILQSQKEKTQKFSVAITGDTESNFIEWGIAALKMFDSSKYHIELCEMKENEARENLISGKLSAYFVLPKNFMKDVVNGKLPQIEFVSVSSDAIDLFKREFSTIIKNYIFESQKATQGLYDALLDNGAEATADRKYNMLSFSFADVILNRDKITEVTTLGVSNGLGLEKYYIGCFVLLFFAFILIPFGAIYIKRENSLEKLLVSRGFSPFNQSLGEFFSLVTCILSLLLVMIGSMYLSKYIFADFYTVVIGDINLLGLLLASIVPILTLSALAFLIFELSKDVASGILLLFFINIAGAYISGCIFPIYSLPASLQTVSQFLPFGILREFLESFLLLKFSLPMCFVAVLYAVLLWLVGFIVKYRKIAGRER